MKLHPDSASVLNTFTAYGDGFVEVNARRHDKPLVMMPEGSVEPWPVDSFETLAEAHFEQLAHRNPELVVLGTGARQRFVAPGLMRTLIARRIGVEMMDSRAACRTYNILMTEGRKVLVAILPP